MQTNLSVCTALVLAILLCTVLCCAKLCYAMLCYDELCYAMLCYAVLCSKMSPKTAPRDKKINSSLVCSMIFA